MPKGIESSNLSASAMSYILLSSILMLDLFSIVFCSIFIREIFRLGKFPPFIKTRAGAVDQIVEIIGTLPGGSVMYDLGCGDGRMLRAVADQNPEAHYKGFEIRRIPYYLAKHRSKGRKNMTFTLGNFHKEKLGRATHIYTYLYPEVMAKLEPVLKQELASGTMLYSLDFTFPTKEPIKIVPLIVPNTHSLAKKLYVYRF
jgi:SAM-dependent methyltransferase